MSSSELIPKIAEAFGLDDCCMQKVLRVEEGEYRLWKLNSKHIPEGEHLNILALHVIAESWVAAEFNVFNARIHEPLFSGISVFSTLCSSGVDRGQILFLGRALLLDSATPPKVSNTTLEYMEETLRDFHTNCPHSVTSGERDLSDIWVENIVQCTDEPGKLFTYMIYVLMGNPRTIYMEALMKGISQLYPSEHPDIIPAILMAALHPDYRVQDWVIQCADGRDCPELVIMLETMVPNADYVNDYREKVLEQYKRKDASNE